MLEFLLIIAAAVLLLAIVLLLWPMRVRILASPEVAQVIVRYFIVRVSLDFLRGSQTVHVLGIPVSSGRAKPTTDKAAPRKRKVTRAGSTSDKMSQARVLWEHHPLLRSVLLQVTKLIGRLLRSWKLERGRIALVLGLGDPAKTGMAAGCVYAALPTLQMALPRWDIAFVPEFSRAQVATEFDITLRLIPLEPLYHILRTLGTLPWRGLWKLKAALTQP